MIYRPICIVVARLISVIAVDEREGKKRDLDAVSYNIHFGRGTHIGYAKFLVIDCIESQAGVAEPGL